MKGWDIWNDENEFKIGGVSKCDMRYGVIQVQKMVNSPNPTLLLSEHDWKYM